MENQSEQGVIEDVDPYDFPINPFFRGSPVASPVRSVSPAESGSSVQICSPFERRSPVEIGSPFERRSSPAESGSPVEIGSPFERRSPVEIGSPAESVFSETEDFSEDLFPNLILSNHLNLENWCDRNCHEFYAHMIELISIKNHLKCALVPITLHDAVYEYEEFLHAGGSLTFSSSRPKKKNLEFNKFYLPMFIYIFLKLLKNNGTDESDQFIFKFEDKFKGIRFANSTVLDKLKQLKYFSDIEDEEHKWLKFFWQNAFVISCSSSTLDRLVHFLSERLKSSVLLSVLRLHFYIDIHSCKSSSGEKRENKILLKSIKRNLRDYSEDIIYEISSDSDVLDTQARKALLGVNQCHENQSCIKSNKRPKTFHRIRLFVPLSSKDSSQAATGKFMLTFSVGLDDLKRANKQEKPRKSRSHINAEEKLNSSDQATNMPAKAFVDQSAPSLQNRVSAADVTVNQSLVAFCFKNERISIFKRKSEPEYDEADYCFKFSTTAKATFLDEYSFEKDLLGHMSTVLILRFSKDCTFLLSASEDKIVLLFSMFYYEALKSFEHQATINDIDISLDSEFFVSATQNCKAYLWSIQDGLIYQSYCGHLDAVKHVRFHQNSLYIATSSLDMTISLFDTFQGNRVRLFVGHNSKIIAIAFLADEDFLVSSDVSGFIIIWKLSNGEALKKVQESCGIMFFSVDPRNLHCYSLDYNYVFKMQNFEDEKDFLNRKIPRCLETIGKNKAFKTLTCNLVPEYFIPCCFKFCRKSLIILYEPR